MKSSILVLGLRYWFEKLNGGVPLVSNKFKISNGKLSLIMLGRACSKGLLISKISVVLISVSFLNKSKDCKFF